MTGNTNQINIHPEIFLMAICSIVSLLIIWSDCSTGYAKGYVQQVCDRGLNIFDIVCLIFLSPLYLIFILFNNFAFHNGGIKLW